MSPGLGGAEADTSTAFTKGPSVPKQTAGEGGESKAARGGRAREAVCQGEPGALGQLLGQGHQGLARFWASGLNLSLGPTPLPASWPTSDCLGCEASDSFTFFSVKNKSESKNKCQM